MALCGPGTRPSESSRYLDGLTFHGLPGQTDRLGLADDSGLPRVEVSDQIHHTVEIYILEMSMAMRDTRLAGDEPQRRVIDVCHV